MPELKAEIIEAVDTSRREFGASKACWVHRRILLLYEYSGAQDLAFRDMTMACRGASLGTMDDSGTADNPSSLFAMVVTSIWCTCSLNILSPEVSDIQELYHFLYCSLGAVNTETGSVLRHVLQNSFCPGIKQQSGCLWRKARVATVFRLGVNQSRLRFLLSISWKIHIQSHLLSSNIEKHSHASHVDSLCYSHIDFLLVCLWIEPFFRRIMAKICA